LTTTKYRRRQIIDSKKISMAPSIFCCRWYFVAGDILSPSIFCGRQYLVTGYILSLPIFLSPAIICPRR
jgi:hypothetical protein